MSCISNNFSSFFLNSLNDSSEFAKYLSNGELKFSSFEDFQVFGSGAGAGVGTGAGAGTATSLTAAAAAAATATAAATAGANIPPCSAQQQQQQQQQQYYTTSNNGNNNNTSAGANAAGLHSASELFNGAAHTEATANYAQQSTEAAATSTPLTPSAAQQQSNQQHHLPQHISHLRSHPSLPTHSINAHAPLHASQTPHSHPHAQHPYIHSAHSAGNITTSTFHQNHHTTVHHPHSISNSTPPNYPTTPQRWNTGITAAPSITTTPGPPHALSHLHNSNQPGTPIVTHPGSAQHFDGSFEFLKYLRHSNDYGEGSDANRIDAAHGNQGTGSAIACHSQQQSSSSSLIDLDSSTAHKSRSSRKVAALLSSVSRASNSLDATTLDVFDHDTKHTIFDLNHITTQSSNSNESSLEVSNLAFPNSHLNASNSNTSSEGAATGNSDFTMQHCSSNSGVPKPLANFTIKDNFDVHPSHKVEEGIFQHMNKLPPKKKENLKQLGVRFTGQMTLADKSIVVDNFIKFCQEYDVKDHRPFLSLNQSGLNKPDQIKFARFLGQGLPTFTLFCIYSNFKNLFCTKRTEIYTKDGYNLPYILDKTKRFLSNTTADLKNMVQQQSNDGFDFPMSTMTPVGNAILAAATNSMELTSPCAGTPKVLENFAVYENFDVHEVHRIEDGVCTHVSRLPPKKQELLKQFGIQSNQTVTYYEKYIIIENFSKFCNEYKISDHRPFLDFHDSGLPKCEQLKFVRYLGQGLSNLTLNKIYLSFKDMLGISRIEKLTADGYNLDAILRKKRKNLYNRMHAAVHRGNSEAATKVSTQAMHLDTFNS